MPQKKPGPSVKDDKTYEALRRDGASKEKAARIANAGAAEGKKTVSGAAARPATTRTGRSTSCASSRRDRHRRAVQHEEDPADQGATQPLTAATARHRDVALPAKTSDEPFSSSRHPSPDQLLDRQGDPARQGHAGQVDQRAAGCCPRPRRTPEGEPERDVAGGRDRRHGDEDPGEPADPGRGQREHAGGRRDDRDDERPLVGRVDEGGVRTGPVTSSSVTQPSARPTSAASAVSAIATAKPDHQRPGGEREQARTRRRTSARPSAATAPNSGPSTIAPITRICESSTIAIAGDQGRQRHEATGRSS